MIYSGLPWGGNGTAKGRVSQLSSKAMSTKDMLHAHPSDVGTTFLPKALEVGSSSSLLRLTSENTFCLLHLLC